MLAIADKVLNNPEDEFYHSTEKCSKPQNVSYLASVAPDSAEIEAGEKYTITCTDNFVPGEAELVCQDDGTLSPAAECVSGTCPKPDLTDNVESITPDSTIEAGKKFTVKCKPDFVPEHSELSCGSNGTVSVLDYAPKCIEKGDTSPSTSKLGGKSPIAIFELYFNQLIIFLYPPS